MKKLNIFLHLKDIIVYVGNIKILYTHCLYFSVVTTLVQTNFKDYADVNKPSTDINKNTKQRLRMLHLPAVNQCVWRKSQPRLYIICKNLWLQITNKLYILILPAFKCTIYIFNFFPVSDNCTVLHKSFNILQVKNQSFYTILIFQYCL
jgi:hypothetical protein